MAGDTHPSPAGELAALRAENARLRAELTEATLAEERFRALFEHSSDAHLIFDHTGILDCNAAAIAMLRCTDRSQILALHPAVLSPAIQPDGRTSLEKSREMDRIARERGFHRFEWMHRRMDGEDFPVEVTLTPVRLPTGPVLLVVWRDLTELRAREAALREQLLTVARQEQEIRRLSRPILAVAPGVLLVPIVGALDQGGAAELTAAILRAVSGRNARRVIVDLTGVADVDADTAPHLLRIDTAAALLGAEVVLAGIGPAFARALVHHGADLRRLRTAAVAEDAIAEALRDRA